VTQAALRTRITTHGPKNLWVLHAILETKNETFVCILLPDLVLAFQEFRAICKSTIWISGPSGMSGVLSNPRAGGTSNISTPNNDRFNTLLFFPLLVVKKNHAMLPQFFFGKFHSVRDTLNGVAEVLY
jgi:hypothetical protein